MVLQNMTEKGHSREQAEHEMDLLSTIADCLRRLTLSVECPDGRPRASLEIEFKAPGPRPEALGHPPPGRSRRIAVDREAEARHGL